MAMRKPGAYAPLYANYADDERIMEVGEDAELMYVRMLAYAARTPRTEGWISDRVVLSRLGILPRPAGNGAGTDAGNGAGIEPGTDAGSRAERLRESGLIVRDGDGYRIASWLKWNRSVEEMDREAARDSNRKKSVTRRNDGTGAGNATGSRAGNDAGVPDATPRAEAVQKTEQNHGSTTSRRKPSRPIPDDWRPNDKHAATARERGIDLDYQANRFRTWAESKDQRYVDWDKAFHNWLTSERQVGAPKPAAQPIPDQLSW